MEQTQANAPGQPQAQAPVHPIHEETATLNALTQWVSNSTDNDPHAGTDMEEPKAPPAEEKPVEAEAPKEEEPEQTIEFDEETPFFELDYNGEKRKLSAKELREGYLAKQDYHRNIQKVKADEAAVQEKVKTATLQAQQEYVQRLETHKQAVAKLAGVKSLPEIEELSKSDPAAAQQEFLRVISVNQTLQAIEAEQRKAHESLQQSQQAAIQQAILKSRQTLENDIPGWGEDKYREVLTTVTKDYGFEPNDVAQVYDARLIKVFHDAAQYRSLQKAKPEVSKRVVAVPKVVKPGSAEKPNPAKEQVERSFERLKKTGSVHDAVSAYLSRQKK